MLENKGFIIIVIVLILISPNPVKAETLCSYTGPDLSADYLNCPEDCSSGAGDGICYGIKDGRCDPDCDRTSDLDCEKATPTTAATKSASGFELASVIIAIAFLKRKVI